SRGPPPRARREPRRRAARRAFRGRRVRQLRAARAVAGGRMLVADGALRARDPQAAPRELARALPVDRAERARVFPEPRRACAARCRARPEAHARAFHDACRAGARARDPSVQARRALADERRARAALRSHDMSAPADSARPRIRKGFRLQWEEAQQAHVLLYPEGMVKLNGSAGAILGRCDGERTIAEIVADLEAVYGATGLEGDVKAFVEFALEKNWLELVSEEARP